jgi:uncharacterized protein (DUF2267 family)
MSHSAIPAFDTTLQTTNTWIAELATRLDWEDRHRAYIALRAVLHALRDRLCVDDVASFGAQLPMLVRGFFYEGWHPGGKPTRERKLDQFLSHVSENLRMDGSIDARQVTHEVFGLLKKHLTKGEIHSLEAALPGAYQELWQ